MNPTTEAGPRPSPPGLTTPRPGDFLVVQDPVTNRGGSSRGKSITAFILMLGAFVLWIVF